ncbi:hypothetical protein [Curtobacterium sp. MCSS17_016]|uniref:hypothetical protein n=1 Tax=Curtobacterium sp. MCSS17_016 TaxID=2175644 RepID=UPI000DAAD1A1|nr:hypothetical protein [Curtobacterium sp. MCSS17_016]WIE81170.1 hypothetical protein DEJ19_018225 [Curtobacterium sp. MCSS17_016]
MTDTSPAAVLDWRTDPNRKCLHCGATRRDTIRRRDEPACGTTDPHTGELDAEFPRHRFKPWTENELAAHRQQEHHIAQQMGDMAAWWDREGRHAVA